VAGTPFTGVDGLQLRTWWLDRSGKRAPVKVGDINALSDKETHAFEGGAW
jgi:hypothetical protein